jgi:hypothetical protein
MTSVENDVWFSSGNEMIHTAYEKAAEFCHAMGKQPMSLQADGTDSGFARAGTPRYGSVASRPAIAICTVRIASLMLSSNTRTVPRTTNQTNGIERDCCGLDVSNRPRCWWRFHRDANRLAQLPPANATGRGVAAAWG